MLDNKAAIAQKRPRILSLDLLRGVFMIVIIINHLVWGPSLYTFLTGDSRLLASAAEGFFTISGLLVGYIYGSKILFSTKAIFKKIWKRAFLLYILAVFFTFFYTAWASLHPDSPTYETIYAKGALKYTYNTLSLRYAFGWTDFLTRYSVFMFMAPFALWLIAKGKFWIVAGVSFIVWLTLRQTEFFLPFSAWQVIFFFGMIIGYYLPQIEHTINTSWSNKTKHTAFVSLVSIFLLTYALSTMAVTVLPFLSSHISSLNDSVPVSSFLSFYASIGQYFDKPTLAPARIIVGIVWFSALYVIFRRFEKQINDSTKGVLLLIGQNSLFVYCLHAFVIFTITMYFAPAGEHSLLVNTLVSTLVLVIIYLVTKYRLVFTKLRRRLLPSIGSK